MQVALGPHTRTDADGVVGLTQVQRVLGTDGEVGAHEPVVAPQETDAIDDAAVTASGASDQSAAPSLPLPVEAIHLLVQWTRERIHDKE